MSVVVTSGLTRRFGAITAVNQLTVELPGAGVIGLVGGRVIVGPDFDSGVRDALPAAFALAPY